jgi:hypothetical protein
VYVNVWFLLLPVGVATSGRNVYRTLDLNNKLELEIENYQLFILFTWIIPNDF